MGYMWMENDPHWASPTPLSERPQDQITAARITAEKAEETRRRKEMVYGFGAASVAYHAGRALDRRATRNYKDNMGVEVLPAGETIESMNAKNVPQQPVQGLPLHHITQVDLGDTVVKSAHDGTVDEKVRAALREASKSGQEVGLDCEWWGIDPGTRYIIEKVQGLIVWSRPVTPS